MKNLGRTGLVDFGPRKKKFDPATPGRSSNPMAPARRASYRLSEFLLRTGASAPSGLATWAASASLATRPPVLAQLPSLSMNN